MIQLPFFTLVITSVLDWTSSLRLSKLLERKGISIKLASLILHQLMATWQFSIVLPIGWCSLLNSEYLASSGHARCPPRWFMTLEQLTAPAIQLELKVLGIETMSGDWEKSLRRWRCALYENSRTVGTITVRAKCRVGISSCKIWVFFVTTRWYIGVYLHDEFKC